MSFNIDEIIAIVKQVLHEKIGEDDFVQDRMHQWNVDILTGILQQLQTKSNLKYVVTVLIGEKRKSSGLGLHTAMSCLWNGSSDGCITVKWENKNIFSITSVFGLTM